MPQGHPLSPIPLPAGSGLNNLPNNLAPFLQLLALAEQHARQIAREEFSLLLAEHASATVEADKNEQYLTVTQAAEVLLVKPGAVYEYIKAGQLKFSRTGKSGSRLRLKRGDVQAYLQAQIQPDGRRKYARRVRATSTNKKKKGGAASC